MTRNRILQAATSIAEEEGILRLTLDRVASVAKVSKGALLYHFPNKEALMEGMLDEVVAAFDARVAKHRQSCSSAVESAIAVMVEMATTERNLIAAVIAAITVEPSLRKKFSRHHQNWIQTLVQDGVNPDAARALTYAIDGVFLMSALGVTPVSEQSEAITRALGRIARPTAEEQLYEIFRQAEGQGLVDKSSATVSGETG